METDFSDISVYGTSHRKVRERRRTIFGNRVFYILEGLFFAGYFIGSLLVRTVDSHTLDLLRYLTQGFITERLDQPLLKTFLSSFIGSMILLLVAFILGFSSISQLLTFLIPVFRGLGLGISAGYLYSMYGLQGILFCAVMVLPHVLVSTFALLIGCRESIKFSGVFLSAIVRTGRTRTDTVQESDASRRTELFQLYLLKFALLSILIVVAALIDTLFTFGFARFFHMT